MALYKIDVFTFNDLTKRVLVDSGVVSLTVQRIYNACRLYEAEPALLDNLSICTAGGKNPLGGSKAVGITMTMLDGWQIEFQSFPAEVADGNYLGKDAAGADQNPIFGNVVTRSLDTSAALVTTGGSALTSTETLQLQDIHKLLGLNKSVNITITPAGIDSDDADIDINFSGDGISSTVMDRQP